MERTLAEKQIAVIRQASFEFEDHRGRANLVLEIKLQAGDMFGHWLDKDEAWEVLTKSGVRQVSELVGRPCEVETNGQTAKFLNLFDWK